jgi:endo-1,4-beta-xylanase
VRAFADAHGMAFRGHNLCWGDYNPAWLEALSAGDKQAALRSHIAAVAGHYVSVKRHE